MYLYRNTLDRDEAISFREMVAHMGITPNAKHGPRFTTEARTTRAGTHIVRVQVFTDNPAHVDALSTVFPRKGKVAA